ncbi:MAG TPA: thioredoxin domain-containing protein [Nitrospiraceae bacterium]|nr:thioredoxin domain-containing protein [Nitrospiraceae bacterium]
MIRTIIAKACALALVAGGAGHDAGRRGMGRSGRLNRMVPWTLLLLIGLAAPAVDGAPAAPALQGKFEELNEPSTHTPGKVKMTEFADFYCPHCHRFEQEGLPVLEKEFGKRLEVTMVGFPVIRGKLPTAFEMYEQARAMGKGPEMRRALFRSIHRDRVEVFDRLIRESIIKEVGLDVAKFEAGLKSGKPTQALELGKAWGEAVKVQQTPTILLDGHIKVEDINPENLKVIIRSILDADAKK